MRDRDKRRCWQQILTKIGIDAMAEEDWCHAYEQYKRSWSRIYCIRHSRSTLMPLLNHIQQRPSEAYSASSSSAPFPTAAAAKPMTDHDTHASSVAGPASPTNNPPKIEKICETDAASNVIQDDTNDQASGSKIFKHQVPNAPKLVPFERRSKISSLIKSNKHDDEDVNDVEDPDDCIPLTVVKKRKRGRPSLADNAQSKQHQGANQEEGSFAERPNKKVKLYHNPLSKASREDYKKMTQPYRKSLQIPIQQQQARASPQQARASPKQARASPQQATTVHQKATTSQQKPKTRTIQILEESDSQLQSKKLNPMPPTRSQSAANQTPGDFHSSSQVAKKRAEANGFISGEGLPKPAHMPPTAINLIYQPNNEQPLPEGPKQQLSEEHAAQNLDLTKKASAGGESLASSLNGIHNDHNYIVTSDFRMEDLLMDANDSSLTTVPAGIDPCPSIQDFNFFDENFFNDVLILDIDQRHPVPEGDRVDSKTLTEIDDQMAGTHDILEKLATPLPKVVDNEKSVVSSKQDEVEELDYELDDDILSVAASWDGSDEELVRNPLNLRNKTQSNDQKSEKGPTARDPHPMPMKLETESPARPSSSQISAPPQRGLVKQDGKANVRSETKTDITKVAGRIPKIKPGQLGAQPSVMQRLYDEQYKEEQVRKQEPMTPSPAGPSQRPSQRVNRQREEATAARHEKVQTPVFAPLYQTPPTTSQGSSIPFQEIAPIFQQVVAPSNWMTEVFGVKCMPFLDDCCISFGCNHEMDTAGEVQRRLLRMDDSALQQIYVLSTRSVVIFKNFFISFAEIFLRRNLSSQVLRMISDCRLYKNVAGRLIANIFGILKQRGMENEMTRVLMRDLWMPSTAIKFRDLTISILHVLSKTNWEDYLDQIIRLGSEFKFPIPSEIIIHILQSDRNNNPDVKSATTKLMLCIPVKDLKNPQLVEYLKILAESGAITDNTYSNQNYNQHANALDVRPRTSTAPSTCVTPRRTRWNGPGSNNSPMPGYSMNPITPRSAGPSPGQNSTPNRWMGPQGGGWMGN